MRRIVSGARARGDKKKATPVRMWLVIKIGNDLLSQVLSQYHQRWWA
jgi:hypothetical protein